MIVSRLEEIAAVEQRFKVENGKDGLDRLQGSKEGKKGQLGADVEIYEVSPSFSIMTSTKTVGNTLEHIEFRDQNLKQLLKDIVWAWQGSSMHPGTRISYL
ncbi:hypothetical protein MLD38_021183 [Melastoma candidum]|uniref:Uncharacterized protein n=1 Tax=Melastoma candidum TaxID=119954 RepID=A0ACB9QEQ3_9MYRT|nr:hypothetical protein MLD38_021183 [Melastoma candidum]